MKKTIIIIAAIMSLASCAKTLDLTSVRLSSTTQKSTTTSTPRKVIPNYKRWGKVLTRSNVLLPEEGVQQEETVNE